MLKTEVQKALSTSGLKTVKLLTPKNLLHGDYAFHLSQIDSKNSEDVIKQLSGNPLFESVKIVDGFINLRLSSTMLLSELDRILSLKEKYGQQTTGTGKTMVIDYSAPNIAKRFGFGHLRSTIVGQAIYNLYKFLGWRVIGDNHLGDWGTQFGKMIVAIKKWADKPASKLGIEEMEALYIKFHTEAENDPDLDEQAREAFRNLEAGEAEEKTIWQQLVKSSLLEFNKIYELLGVSIDHSYGESFYEKQMQEIISLAKDKKLAQESDGALIIPFADSKMTPGMLLKKDGATTYFTRDLATIKFRAEEWQPDSIVYEVGEEQSLHFKQVFLAADLLGLFPQNKLIHLPHGLIRLKEGKMSTRKGRTINLDRVIETIINCAKKYNPDPAVAQKVAIAALKYNDLKRAAVRGYIFDENEALRLDGNSGPYLLYTYARCLSVLTKVSSPVISNASEKSQNRDFKIEELALLHSLFRFPEVVEEAADRFAPHLLCTYLFDIAQKYSIFYETLPILKAENEEKDFRLRITLSTGQVLKNGLELLGIETLEKI